MVSLRSFVLCALVGGLMAAPRAFCQENTLDDQGTQGVNLALSVNELSIYKLYYPVDSDRKERVRVSIYNEDGGHLFTDRMRARETFVRRYNMSKLPDGEYVFRIKGDEGVRELRVRHYHTGEIDMTASGYEHQVVSPNRSLFKRRDQSAKALSLGE
ncbi:MAG: hypothetical protein WBA12_11690 [Catalinimonas sp.]